MAVNPNDQMEIRQETFLSSSQNTREENLCFSSTVTSFVLI